MSTEQLAERLAEAEAALNAKTAERDAAHSKVADIRQRIAELEEQQRSITAKRVSGSADPEDASEFAALAADIELLREHLAEADVACNRISLSREQAQYESAKFQFEDHQRRATLAALVTKAQEIDAMLVRCISEIRQAGEAMNQPILAHLWKPSTNLHRSEEHTSELQSPLNLVC